MCKCIEKLNILLLDRAKEKHPGSDIQKAYGLLNVYLDSEGEEIRPYMDFQYSQRKKKKDGSWGKQVNRTSTVTMPYCPFCGQKYETKNN